MPDLPPRQWVLLTHQIPSQPSGFRVKVWRRLQGLGAIAVRQSVYVLPSGPEHLEDFQWLRQEIIDAGGEATVFRADAMDQTEDQEIVRAFQEAREHEYVAILEELVVLEKACLEGGERHLSADLDKLRQRLQQTTAIDFFEAPSRMEALATLQRCEQLLDAPPAATAEPALADPAQYRQRRWVTRRKIHIDRIASAWLIRRFIDTEARFAFVEEGAALRADDVPFDMFGVAFGHRGGDCTFETLKKAFALDAPGLEVIARIIHDADLKDGKFGRRDTDGIEKAVRCLSSQMTDAKLVELGLLLFDGLLEIVREEGMP